MTKAPACTCTSVQLDTVGCACAADHFAFLEGRIAALTLLLDESDTSKVLGWANGLYVRFKEPNGKDTTVYACGIEQATILTADLIYFPIRNGDHEEAKPLSRQGAIRNSIMGAEVAQDLIASL